MIIVPIAIAWFQIHVSSGHTNGVQRIFDPIKEVLTHSFAHSHTHTPLVSNPNQSANNNRTFEYFALVVLWYTYT